MGCCFEKDVTDLMDCCQMGDVLSEEEVQIISYYLDLTGGEVGEDGEGEDMDEGKEFHQYTQLMVGYSFLTFDNITK